MTKISKTTAFYKLFSYHEDWKVGDCIVPLDVRVRIRIFDWKAEIPEHTYEEVNRKADEVLFGEYFVHPA